MTVLRSKYSLACPACETPWGPNFRVESRAGAPDVHICGVCRHEGFREQFRLVPLYEVIEALQTELVDTATDLEWLTGKYNQLKDSVARKDSKIAQLEKLVRNLERTKDV